MHFVAAAAAAAAVGLPCVHAPAANLDGARGLGPEAVLVEDSPLEALWAGEVPAHARAGTTWLSKLPANQQQQQHVRMQTCAPVGAYLMSASSGEPPVKKPAILSLMLPSGRQVATLQVLLPGQSSGPSASQP